MTSKNPKRRNKKDEAPPDPIAAAKKAERLRKFEELKAFNEKMLENGKLLNRLLKIRPEIKKLKNS